MESTRDEQSASNKDSVEAARAKASVALVYGATHDDDSSSAILSSEAERILENAKKRLTVCLSTWQSAENRFLSTVSS